MAHLRSQIFAAVKAQLSTIPEFSGAGKVERGRPGRIPEEMLPALTLSWADRPEPATVRPSATMDGADGYDRTLPLSIIVHLKELNPDDEFDRICTFVEVKMAAIIELPGLTIQATLRSTEYFINRETGMSLLAGSLDYPVEYKTVAADPTIAAQ